MDPESNRSRYRETEELLNRFKTACDVEQASTGPKQTVINKREIANADGLDFVHTVSFPSVFILKYFKNLPFSWYISM